MKVAKKITFLEEDLDEDAFEDMIAEELIPYAVKAVAFDITVAEGYGIEQRIIAVEFDENSKKYIVWEFNPSGKYTGSQEYNAKEFTNAYGEKDIIIAKGGDPANPFSCLTPGSPNAIDLFNGGQAEFRNADICGTIFSSCSP